VLSVLLWLTVFDYLFWYLQTFSTQGQKFVDAKRGNQRPSITEGQTTQGQKVWSCPSVIDGFCLPFWFLQTFGPCVVCPSVIDGLWLSLLVSSNFWPLCCLSFCDCRSLVSSFGFFKLLAFVLSVLLWLTVFDYLFWYLQTFGPCVVCPSVIDGLWLPFWHLQTFTDNTGAKSLKKPKEVIKDRQSQKNRQHKGQKFEETERGNQRPTITEGQTTQGSKVWRYQKR
jgi:hypothetical protein